MIVTIQINELELELELTISGVACASTLGRFNPIPLNCGQFVAVAEFKHAAHFKAF